MKNQYKIYLIRKRIGLTTAFLALGLSSIVLIYLMFFTSKDIYTQRYFFIGTFMLAGIFTGIFVTIFPHKNIYTVDQIKKKKWFNKSVFNLKKQEVFGDGFLITLTENSKNWPTEIKIFTKIPAYEIQGNLRLDQLILF